MAARPKSLCVIGPARARITRVVAALRPAGNVLEIACGTALWTSALAGVASTVTAIDATPEAVDIARGRVKAASVRFEVADVFSRAAAARFDTVFFAFWLSHVPASRFAQFWRQLRGLVTGHGRVLFVDEHRFRPGWPWAGLVGKIPQEPLGFQPGAYLLTNALMTIILSAGA
jgi:2-polyprenyl-3-methyl-5-hydroxy-6-metoxy-1,4-benzoquinol methylase